MSDTATSERAAKVSGKVSVGHPVDVATGTLTHDFEDHELPGRVPLVFARRYSSGMFERPDGIFGPGWSSPLQMFLRQDLEGYQLLAEDGETLIPFDDSDESIASGRPLRNLGIFHELRCEGEQYVATRWNPESQEVVRYVFGKGEAGACWPLLSRHNVAGHGIDIRRDRQGQILTVRQRREGRGYRLVYNERGLVTEVHVTTPVHERLILRYAYDQDGRLCEMLDAIGQRCAYEYDAAGRMSREINLGGMVYRFRFDNRGRCVETTGLDGYGRSTLQIEDRARITQVSDALDHVTVYRWNESGQVEQQISPLGNITNTTYDAEGRIVEKIEPTGASTKYEYDARGDRKKVISPTGAVSQYEYDDNHQVVVVTDPAGHRWQRSYHESGQIAAVTNPLGESLAYSYDVRGDLSELKDTAGRTRSYTWDAAGNLLSSCDPLGHRTRYEYDDEGSLANVTDAKGHNTQLLRDDLARVGEVRLPDGARRRFARDAYNQITQYVDELGAVTQRRYAACGLLAEEVRPGGGRIQLAWSLIPGQLLAVCNELGERHTFEYDAQGRMTRQVNFAGHATHYEYDKGTKASVIRDAAGNRTRLERNASGTVTQMIPANGLPVVYEHDVRGLLTKADNGECPIVRKYDALGRLTFEQQGQHEVHSEYDVAGNRYRRRSSLGHETVFEWDANSQLALIWQDDLAPIRFEYDAVGNEISRSIRDGVRITHDYDSRDRRSEQKVGKHSPRMGQVRVGEDTLGFRKYNYDAANNLTEILDEQHGITQYQYDLAGRIVAARMPDGFSERFSYDPAGNIRQIERTAGALSDISPLPALQKLDYQRGNVLTKSDGADYEYNVLGQQVRKREVSGETKYFWNAYGQLAKVELPDGSRWTYRYDGIGRRVEKRNHHERTEFVWDGNVVLHEVKSTGQGDERAVHWEFEPYGFTPLGKIELHAHYLCVNNVNGAPYELCASDGKVVWSARYAAFGSALVSPNSEIDCPIRFQGQWLDEETQLSYNHFRHYDSLLGRYICSDLMGIIGGANYFVYPSNPLGWIDPYGLANKKCDLIVYRQLSQEDLAALNARLPINPKGSGGSIADHVASKPTGYISASMRRAPTSRFDSGHGVVATNVRIAIEHGTGYVEHNNVIQAVRRDGNANDLRNATRAEEVLFKGPIPYEAITLLGG